MIGSTEVIRKEDGRYYGYVDGYLVGSYSTKEKALFKMYKYAKSQGL